MEQNNSKIQKIMNEPPRFFPGHPNYSKTIQFVAETKHPVYITKMTSVESSTFSGRVNIDFKNKGKRPHIKSNVDRKIYQDNVKEPKKQCQGISPSSSPQDVLEDEAFSKFFVQLKKQLTYSPPLSDLSSDSS